MSRREGYRERGGKSILAFLKRGGKDYVHKVTTTLPGNAVGQKDELVHIVVDSQADDVTQGAAGFHLERGHVHGVVGLDVVLEQLDIELAGVVMDSRNFASVKVRARLG